MFVISFFWEDQFIIVPTQQKCVLQLILDSNIKNFGGDQDFNAWSVETRNSEEVEADIKE